MKLPIASAAREYSEDAERATLSSVLMDNAVVGPVRQLLKPDDFYRVEHRHIYIAILAIVDRGDVADPITLSHELDRLGGLHAAGGKNYIGELVDFVPTASNAEYYARIVLDFAQRRVLGEVLERSVLDLRTAVRTPAEVAQRLLPALGTLQPDTDGRVWRLEEILADEDLMRPAQPVIPGIAWSGRSTLLAAQEKVGKSTLLACAAAQVTHGGEFLGGKCRQGNVLVVGLEEFVGDTARRLCHFGADASRLYVADRMTPEPSARLAFLRSLITDHDPVLVVLDSLSAWWMGVVTDTQGSGQTGPVVQGLTDIAHQLRTAVVIIHHGRKSDGSYRDSSAIGAAVDIIAEIFAPEPDGDPSLRRAKVRGRLPVRDFSFRYTGDGFELAGDGDLPKDLKVLDFIRLQPGCSQKKIRDSVTGKAKDIDAAVQNLLQRGLIVDDFDKKTGHHYTVSDSVSENVNPVRRGVDDPQDLRSTSHGLNGTALGRGEDAPVDNAARQIGQADSRLVPPLIGGTRDYPTPGREPKEAQRLAIVARDASRNDGGGSRTPEYGQREAPAITTLLDQSSGKQRADPLERAPRSIR